MDNKEQYQKEQDQLLQTILDYRFFNPWKNITAYANSNRSLRLDTKLELYITSSCNQKCEYCYLQKYPQLYPKDANKPEIILHNLEIFLKYLKINNYQIPEVSLFSGDIWTSEFGWQVLEIIYQYVKDGLHLGCITLPSNCSFVSDPKAVQKMQQYIGKFNSLNCPLIISISVDGKIIDNAGRPRNDPNNTYTDEFYERIGAFANLNGFLFHPMVSAQNVKYWIENYEWWEQYLKYYDYDSSAIMMLEVRDGNWTDENIKDYCKFLTYLLDKWMQERCNNNPQIFANQIAHTGQAIESLNLSSGGGYLPWLVGQADTFVGCTVANHLTVRIGDLAICPCHRTAYNEYLYGYFTVKNDRIVGIHAVNPLIAIKIFMGNVLTSAPLCDQCIICDCCLKGCLGSQFEYGRDIFMPLTNICKFFHKKTATIFKYYREHGIIRCLEAFDPNEHFSDTVASVLRVNDMIGGDINELGKI